MGGHSGDDINKGRANANQLLVFFLARIWPKTEVQLARINGGNLRNAIAREAEAVISIPMAYKEQIRIEWNQYVAQMEGVFGEVEKDMRMEPGDLRPAGACMCRPIRRTVSSWRSASVRTA